MIEKVISIEDIPPVELLGANNQNIKEVAAAFPKSKIVSRGNEIKIIGAAPEILKINDILLSLMNHYAKYGKVTQENVHMYLKDDHEKPVIGTRDDVILFGTKGIVVKAKSKNQQELVNASEKNDLVFAIGPAGSGKTYISVALAVKALKNKEVRKIIITRPAVEAGENLGFLPGDLQEKVEPYLRPVYDALSDMISTEKLNFYKENGVVEVAPLAYMRGRTLDNAFIILDEAQNTTPMQLKMFLTRLGPKAKMIITGDVSQVDLPKNQKSGLIQAIEVLKDVKEIKRVYLSSDDVVRHNLVKKIIEAYDDASDKG